MRSLLAIIAQSLTCTSKIMLAFKTSALPKKICLTLSPVLYILLLSLDAVAGCVASDLNSQVTIASPTTPPPIQTNNLDVRFGENCLGNSSHGHNLQIYAGDKPVRQERQRRSFLGSQKEDSLPLITTPNIETSINQQIYLPVLP